MAPWGEPADRPPGQESGGSALGREVSNVDSLSAPGHDPIRDELCTIIDEEIDRLPDNYRNAIVLCDLEGLTHDAAARQLGCPSGTIASRLSRGRQRLRNRLARRGLAPSAASLPAALRYSSVPSEMAGVVVRMATRSVTGHSRADVVPAAIHALAAGFLRATTMSQIKTVALVLALIAVGASGVALGSRARAGEARNRGPHAARSGPQSPRL